MKEERERKEDRFGEAGRGEGSISNFATGSFKFLFALIQVFSKVFNLEAIG